MYILICSRVINFIYQCPGFRVCIFNRPSAEPNSLNLFHWDPLKRFHSSTIGSLVDLIAGWGHTPCDGFTKQTC